MDDRVDGPIRAMNRAPSYEYLAKDNALRPGGGAVREPSMPSLRPGGPGALGAGAGARGSGIRCLQPLSPDMCCLLWHDYNSLGGKRACRILPSCGLFICLMPFGCCIAVASLYVSG